MRALVAVSYWPVSTAIVDASTRKVAGTTADPPAIRSMLVQMVYEEMGLRYDRDQGASAYTSYKSDTSYEGGKFDLAAFMKKFPPGFPGGPGPIAIP